eukprot:CAMPEP_0173141594 /NCGR_PEP_ID=MMETSP1105-20130129/5593_1 /TAXON_ID=2985 /ORGANISM="Ochromonas sp., Strain BG-1" /LENGTH=74 /DNA_ID=CAMNT_0014054839 /DNA_START=449 /DNA_END=673 /DNA_ORIENTATION=-
MTLVEDVVAIQGRGFVYAPGYVGSQRESLLSPLPTLSPTQFPIYYPTVSTSQTPSFRPTTTPPRQVILLHLMHV